MIKNSTLIITAFLITSPLASSFLIASEHQAIPKINVFYSNPFSKNPLTIECNVSTKNSTFKLSADDINYAFAEPHLNNIKNECSKDIYSHLYYITPYNNHYFNLSDDTNKKIVQLLVEKSWADKIIQDCSNKPVPVQPSRSEYLNLLKDAEKRFLRFPENALVSSIMYIRKQLDLSIHKWENGLRDIERLDIKTNNSVNQIDLTGIIKDKVPKLSELVINGKLTPINTSSIYNAN